MLLLKSKTHCKSEIRTYLYVRFVCFVLKKGHLVSSFLFGCENQQTIPARKKLITLEDQVQPVSWLPWRQKLYTPDFLG